MSLRTRQSCEQKLLVTLSVIYVRLLDNRDANLYSVLKKYSQYAFVQIRFSATPIKIIKENQLILFVQNCIKCLEHWSRPMPSSHKPTLATG